MEVGVVRGWIISIGVLNPRIKDVTGKGLRVNIVVHLCKARHEAVAMICKKSLLARHKKI